jgi:tRNA pseudouridine synthase 10
MGISRKAQIMLMKYPLCDHCLGRQFAFLGYGMDAQERGQIIKTILTMNGHKLLLSKNDEGVALLKVLARNGFSSMATEILRKFNRRSKKGADCTLCEGRFQVLDSLINAILQILKKYEYDTFLVGIKLPNEIEEREDELRAEFKVQHAESIRNEYSRIIGKKISDATSKNVDFMKPQIVVLVNPFTEEIQLQVNPLFIMGRYLKLVRGIPQSKWFCSICRGKGCEECKETGKMYPESVEELISEPILEKTNGKKSSFHGAGREDIDARMLGNGRPFIIQIKNPQKRKIDLSEIEKEINKRANNKIKVRKLKFVDNTMVRKLKSMEASNKTYKVNVKFSRRLKDEELEKLKELLDGVTILQKTPIRVIHRRANLQREKEIYETRIKRISTNSIEMRIRCQGGLYIKEVITGDDGRTNPNVSEIVGVKAKPLDLDVLDISARKE